MITAAIMLGFAAAAIAIDAWMSLPRPARSLADGKWETPEKLFKSFQGR